MMIGDLAIIEDKGDWVYAGTKRTDWPYNEDFNVGDVVYILDIYCSEVDDNLGFIPRRYKVRNTENDKVFNITWDKLDPIEVLSNDNYDYYLEYTDTHI